MEILQRLEWFVKTASSHKLAINSIEDLFTPNIHVVTNTLCIYGRHFRANEKQKTIHDRLLGCVCTENSKYLGQWCRYTGANLEKKLKLIFLTCYCYLDVM